MNFLAHLLLSPNEAKTIVGNISTDFYNWKDLKNIPPDIQVGVSLHHLIDEFTDSHSVVKQSFFLFKKDFRLLSGVLVDIFYDYILARNFDDFANTTLSEFSLYINGLMQQHQNDLPDSLKKFLPTMIQENILSSYKDLSGIDKALQRIQRRLSFSVSMERALPLLEANYDSLEQHFYKFFPEIISATASYREGFSNFLKF